MQRATFLCALACALLLAGTELVAPAAQTQPKAAKASGQAAAQTQDTPIPVPAEARARRNPQPASPESIATGKLLFSSQCTMCHGTKGDGKGDLVERLQLTVPDLTDAQQQKRWTDGELFWVLTHGHGRMRGEGDRLSDDAKWNLVNYVRSLGRAR